MNPIAFRIGFITVYWYGIMAGSAMLAGYFLSRRWALHYGIDEDAFDWLVVILLPTIVIGARAAYVIASWSYFREHPLEIIRTDLGGLGSHGAIIGAVLVGWYASRYKGLDFWNFADAFAPAFPLAHIFIRLGNFINGELYGLPTDLPWAMEFPGALGLRHPSMLYEAVASLGTLALSLWWSQRRRIKGEVFLKTLIAISLVRLAVDYTRPRDGGIVLGMMLTQLLALGIAVISAVMLRLRPRA